MSIRDTINSWLFAALLVLLVLSLVIHSLTYFNYDPHALSSTIWYGLQLSCVAALTTAIIVGRRHDQKLPRPNQSKERPLSTIDNVIGVCFGLAIFYACFNWMFTGHFLLHGATPQLVYGQYATGSHGHFTMVSKEAFMKALVYEARMNSGHWMAFYLLAISTWLWRLRETAN